VPLDGLGGVDGDLVVGGVAVLDAEVVVVEVHIQVRMDQPVLDELPDDPGHLIAVQLYDGPYHLDLRHLSPLACVRTRTGNRRCSFPAV
jgi:hypothetical protein